MARPHDLRTLLRHRPDQPRGGTKALVLVLLAAAALMVLDARAGSPLDPARGAVGSVVGPVESAAGGAVRPFRAVADSFHTTGRLRHDVASLEAQNSDLRTRLASDPLDRNRLAEYDGLVSTARDTGYTLVPAHVVAIGPGQSFRRTVTIDAGTSSGIRPDRTVVSRDGLVGRVVRATRHSATVLLLVDRQSVVGGRLGSNLKLGFVRGDGTLGDRSRLALDLVDDAGTAARGDVVVSWGSGTGGPYVPGIPIGRVTAVSSSPRQLSTQAVVQPFVDFSALDLVGVVVPAKTHGDRPLVRPSGAVK